MQKLNKIRRILIYWLIPVVFMPFYPSIKIGASEDMNYELTLPMIWLVVFFIVSVPFFIKNFKKLFLNKITIIMLLFPIYATVSLLWTPNLVRGILTDGLLWLIVFAIMSIVDYFRHIKNESSSFCKKLFKLLLITAFVECVICWLQCILDVFGVEYSSTALCVVCTYKTFGFPHPNGLAIEPQYMGNLLLAPALLSAYLLFTKKMSTKRSVALVTLLVFYISTLFLTLSRGAIFSFSLAFVILAVLIAIKNHSILVFFQHALIALLAFCIAVVAQGSFSALSPLSTDFFTGVSVYINQLSLGIIDLKSLITQEPTNQVDDQNESVIVEAEDQAVFDGYIEASTDIRKTLSAFSYDLWLKKPSTSFLGVGYGGAGRALYEAYQNEVFSEDLYEQYPEWIIQELFSTPKQIVQNEFAAILLEFGIVGFALVMVDILIIIRYFYKKEKTIVIICLAIAYGASFVFLSGFTNVFHAYLLMPLYYYMVPKPEGKEIRVPCGRN